MQRSSQLRAALIASTTLTAASLFIGLPITAVRANEPSITQGGGNGGSAGGDPSSGGSGGIAGGGGGAGDSGGAAAAAGGNAGTAFTGLQSQALPGDVNNGINRLDGGAPGIPDDVSAGGGGGGGTTAVGGVGGAGGHTDQALPPPSLPFTGSNGGDSFDGGGGGGSAGLVLTDPTTTSFVTNGNNVQGGNGGNNTNGGGGGGGGAGLVVANPIAVTVSSGDKVAGGAGGSAGETGGGGGAGLFMFNGGTLTNNGTLMGGNGGGGGNSTGSTGGSGGAGFLGNNAIVTNNGTIKGGNGGNGFLTLTAGGGGGAGVQIFGGAFTNSATGSITGGNVGTGSLQPVSGAAGVVLTAVPTGTTSSLTNMGSISGGTSNGSAPGGIGVDVQADNSTVVNAGTIAAGDFATNPQAMAVMLGGQNDTLVLQSGYRFNGLVAATNDNITLALGGTTNASFDVSQIGNIGSTAQFQGFSALDKIGTSTWTLTGTSTFTGPMTVDAGTLLVNGDTHTFFSTTVNAGGTLGGTGIVAATTIMSGGTLAPGSTANPTGMMSITGNLAFQSGALYLVAVTPSSAASTMVSGSAMLTGASVQTAFAPGSYVTKSYDILHAGGLGGTTFTGISGNLPAGFSESLSYTATDVMLNLTLNTGNGSGAFGANGLNRNQQNAANAISSFFNNGGALPPEFVNLVGLTGSSLSNGLSQVSGEAATGAERGVFQMTTQFLDLLLDPWASGRSGGGSASGFAPEQQASLPPDIALAYASVLKAPATKAPANFDARWNVWGSAFGGTSNTNGNSAAGTSNLTAGDYGFAAGADYRVSPYTTLGFALAGGGTNWNLAQGLGGGRSDAFQAGVYGKSTFGAAYVSAALSFGNNWFKTSRTALGDQLTASFEGQDYAGRVEGGYRFALPVSHASFGITPYAALQTQLLHTPGYSETDLTGGGFGLGYGGLSATDTRSELGARFDNLQVIDNMPLMLRARVAWAHDWVSDPSLQATFQTLPGSSFIVNGAALPADSALITASAELRLNATWSLLAKFDGEFASNSQTYAGTGTLRASW